MVVLTAVIGLRADGLARAAATDDDARLAQSLALCNAADVLPESERMAALARGLDLADAVLANDQRSARAHFAVVCNLGKAIGFGGYGFRSLGAVYRVRREIDTTLLLAPDDPDALAAKGALLLRLPRLLGGDATEAEVWLRRALDRDPENVTARAYLAEIIGGRGFVAPAVGSAALP